MVNGSIEEQQLRVEGGSPVVRSLLSCLITMMTWVLVLDGSVLGYESHGH